MLCRKKLHSNRIYIESVTKCNQLKDWFAGAGKMIPKLHANHSNSIEKYLVSSFRYFFAEIVPPIIRQTHDEISIYFKCSDLIVNVCVIYDQSIGGPFSFPVYKPFPAPPPVFYLMASCLFLSLRFSSKLFSLDSNW
jgi:hypothetical protein